MKSVFFVISLALGTSLAYAKTQEGQDRQSFQCKRKDEKRTVEIRYLEPTKKVPCEVVYDNGSGPKTAWRATSELGYCEKNAHTLVEKLKSNGWQCESSEKNTEHAETKPAAKEATSEGADEERPAPQEKVKPEEKAKSDKTETEGSVTPPPAPKGETAETPKPDLKANNVEPIAVPTKEAVVAPTVPAQASPAPVEEPVQVETKLAADKASNPKPVKARRVAAPELPSKEAEVIDAKSADSIEIPAAAKSELEGGQIDQP